MNEEEYKPLSKVELELRNKPWSELTDSQKIERQRDIIKDLQRSNGYMSERLNRLEQNFNQHQHTDKGIVVPILGNGFLGAVGSGMAKSSNSNYF